MYVYIYLFINNKNKKCIGHKAAYVTFTVLGSEKQRKK